MYFWRNDTVRRSRLLAIDLFAVNEIQSNLDRPPRVNRKDGGGGGGVGEVNQSQRGAFLALGFAVRGVSLRLADKMAILVARNVNAAFMHMPLSSEVKHLPHSRTHIEIFATIDKKFKMIKGQFSNSSFELKLLLKNRFLQLSSSIGKLYFYNFFITF